MKKTTSLILLTFFIIFTGKIYSQEVHIEPFGGLTIVTAPNELTNDISQNGAGFSTGFHVGLRALTKVPMVPYSPYLFFNFQRLTGQQNTLLGNVNTSMNIYDLGVGLRTNLIPGPVNPYLTIYAAYNNLGELKMETPLGTNTSSSKSRVGVGLGAGLNIGVPFLFNVDAEVTYDFLNLIGKSSGEKGMNVINLTVGISP
jgi:Outer membrane protein beta-barrel domain